jgi:DNA-binding GntR family transcriptional regulator
MAPAPVPALDWRAHSQLSDQIASHVRELIMSGRVRAGEFLRLEKLAAELGVSATPVREGLLALRGEGFVQLAPRRGFVVAPLRRQDVEDLFFVQAELAGELAARAATRVHGVELARIEAAQDALEAAAPQQDMERLEALNHEFHRAINRSADSAKLTWFIATAARYAPRSYYGSIPGWQQASLDDHRAIIDALRDRDGDRAKEAMREHILHAGRLLVQHLEHSGLWA